MYLFFLRFIRKKINEIFLLKIKFFSKCGITCSTRINRVSPFLLFLLINDPLNILQLFSIKLF